MQSMTGYGSASSSENGGTSVELRSVNNRFLKLSTRLPEALQNLQQEIENRIRAKIGRGTVSCMVNMGTGSERGDYRFNESLAETYYKLIADFGKKMGIEAPVSLDAIVSLPGVITEEAAGRNEEVVKQVLGLVDEAVDALVKMRKKEGKSIEKDIVGRVDSIGELLKTIEKKAPDVAAGYKDRILERVRALLADTGVEIEDSDVVREVAIYAERSDISEELQRSRSHLKQMKATLKNNGQKGRKLEFITQELLRESNTMAAKAGSADLVTPILEMKSEIDRVREQIQNVE